MEPIAVIGIGCRFPQANSPDAYWQLLESGVCAIGEVPRDRWQAQDFYHPDPQEKGKTNSLHGGFLEDIDCFDARFFGISEAEAGHIDPQQRLFLEVAWEALEHANISPLSLSGSKTGVFTGLCTIDYHRLLYRDFEQIGTHSGTGTTMSITANRLSYLLNLRGPSMAVDAACASSLVAVHLACQSLRAEETDLCVVGGVNLILSPDSMISSAKTGLLSAQGACRPFDRAADGYVRGEGCGVVVLRRLSSALSDGDNVLAVIRGSSINQDGLSNSLTAPNGLAQQDLIVRSLAASGVDARDIDYVEAHAVGTSVGDAIEFRALEKVFSPGRARPCWLGSAKPNIGHLEAASGMAALIKVILSLQNKLIPPLIGFEQANDFINFEKSRLTVVDALKAWPRHGDARTAGVSAFGFGGTNAHVVVEEAPARRRAVREKNMRSHYLLPLSAKSPAALRAIAGRYAAFLSSSTASTEDICATAAVGRSHFAHRLCLVGSDNTDLAQQIALFIAEDSSQRIIAKASKGRKRPSVVFHFPPPDRDMLRLGKWLYQTQHEFRTLFDDYVRIAEIEGCDELLHLEENRCSRLNLNRKERAVSFVAACSLARLWMQWGVKPLRMTGEGTGQYVAECVADRVSIRDALSMFFEEAFCSVKNNSNDDEKKTTNREPGDADTVLWISGICSDDAEYSASTRPSIAPRKVSQYEASQYEASQREASRYESGQHRANQKKTDIKRTDIKRTDIKRADERRTDPKRAALKQANLKGVKQANLEHQKDLILNIKAEVWPQILSFVGQLFISGVAIDWQSFHKGYSEMHVSLPTYPFERSRYWFTLSNRSASNRSASDHSVPNRSTSRTDPPAAPSVQH